MMYAHIHPIGPIAVTLLLGAIAFWLGMYMRIEPRREARREERAAMWQEAQTRHLVSLIDSREGLEATVAAIWYTKDVFNCSLRDAVAIAAPEHLERFDGKPNREPTATEVQRTFNEWARVIRNAQIGNVPVEGATSPIPQSTA